MSVHNTTGASVGNDQMKRELGLLDATLLVVGSMIGSGIFIVSADIGRQVGSPGYLLLVWLVSGLLTMVGALSYGELAGMMPKAGGQYVYLREAYNPLTGFLYGWAFFLVIQTGTIAAVAIAFAKYTAVLLPWFSPQNILIHVGNFGISSNQLLAMTTIILLTFLNIQGVKTGKYVQLIFTVTKIAALVGLIILGIFVGRNATAMQANFSDMWTAVSTQMSNGQIISTENLSGMGLLIAIGLAMVGSLFSSDAWNNVTFTAGEIKDPKRNLPLSLFLGTLIVTLIYILANVAYLMVLPLKGDPAGADVLSRGIQFASEERVATAAAHLIFGDPAVAIMAVFIMISTFGCNNGLIMAGARVYYAMAKDRLFFKKAGELNKQSVPGFALVIQCVWTCLLCLSGTYGVLLDYVIFVALLFYITTVGAVFVLRKKAPQAERPYKAFGYPFIPALYIIVALAVSIDLLIFKSSTSWAGVFIVASGVPVYFLMKRSNAQSQS
ncbi:MAG: amino acid permease [Bacteroidota bacterium]